MILCIGEAVIDMVQTPAAGLGEVFYPLPGGCPYNTSIAIGRLGTPVAFLGRLSKNFIGEIQIKRLRENHVRDDLLTRSDQNSLMAIIKTEKDKDPQYAFYYEGTAEQSFSADDLPPVPADTTCIVFGSISMNMEPIATTIETFIFREAGKNTVIAFDPNIRPFMIKDRDAYMRRFEKWVSVCTIAKISSEDFEFIYPNMKLEDALQKTLNLGTRLAIATLGSQGATALLKRDDGSVAKAHSPGINIPKVADTVGAGDTFLGALLVWLEQRKKMSHNAVVNLSGTDLHEALAFANKAAAIVCTRHGAEPPGPAEMES